MSEYSFKKFTKTGVRTGNYSISLNVSNTFGFNSGFYNKENIKDYKKVILFYDKEKNAVAFKFTNEEKQEGIFTVIHHKGTGSVACRSFVLGNDLANKEYYGKKTPKKIFDKDFGELFVIELKLNEKEIDKENKVE